MEDGDIVLEERSSDKKITQYVETTPNRSHAAQVKWTGKTCAMVLVVVIASIAIIVFAILVAMIIFNPQARESNAEIETLRQQFENLKLAVTQIQQSQGTNKEELSREGIQEMIHSSNQQLQGALAVLNSSILQQQLQVNTSLQVHESKVQSLEQKIENAIENSAAKIQVLQWDLQRNNTAIQLEVNKRLEELQLEMQETNTLIQTEINQRLEELSLELNTTNLETHIMDFDQKTTILNETISLQLSQVNKFVNQRYAELQVVLENATAPLVNDLYQLSGQMTESLENLQIQFINAIHDVEQRLNKSNNDLGDSTGSELCYHYLLTHFTTIHVYVLLYILI